MIGAIVSAIASLIASIFSALKSRKKKEREEEQRKIFLIKFNEMWEKSYKLDFDNDYTNRISKYYFYDTLHKDTESHKNWRIILSQLSTPISETEIDAKVKEKFDEIKNRVEEIEKRFPKESTIEKIASVNDAILATNIESLTESLKRIEDKMLTKWDVVKIVFEVIAVIGLIVGLVFAILEYFRSEG